jgi:peptidoglycan/LPS O-acetylase OafA/YrhL
VLHSLAVSDLESSIVLALAYVAIILSTAVATSAAVIGLSGTVRGELTPQANRDGCLDGLRGPLALSVFTYHSFAAYVYFSGGQWAWTSSPLFNQLGQSSVALFFMITAYLFSKRLLGASLSPRAVGWRGLYVSRLARLTPLYAVVVCAVVISVFSLDFTLHEPLLRLGHELASWFLFVIPGRPDINRLPNTWTLIAGVNWTLEYEWYFYFALPLLFWPLRLLSGPKGARLALAAFTTILLIGVLRRRDIVLTPLYVLHFAAGIVAALVYRDDVLRRVIASPLFGAIALLALVLLGLRIDSHSAIAVGLTFVVFLAVLGGSSLGGFLRRPAVIWLGEISYGIYLIHGMVIFWVLHSARETAVLAKLNLPTFTLMAAGMAVVIVILASVSFVYLEKPAMNWAKRLTLGWRNSRRDLASVPS